MLITNSLLYKVFFDIFEEIKKGCELYQLTISFETKGKLGEGMTAAGIMANSKKSTDLASAVKDADIVIEAVVERMDVKKDVCKTTMDNGPSHIIFASNTSTMSITEIGKNCGAPERVYGIHFFNPVPLMRCIEVIKGADTSEETFNTTMDVAEKLPCLRGKRYYPLVNNSSFSYYWVLFSYIIIRPLFF